MTVDDIRSSATTDDAPPSDLTPELESLWHCKAGNWDRAHDIAQEIHTPMGSWIHALLHLIEGDTSNAGYWFSRAGKEAKGMDEIDALWETITAELVE